MHYISNSLEKIR